MLLFSGPTTQTTIRCGLLGKIQNATVLFHPSARQRLETPTISRFTRYELRTTDPDAARLFYARLLGHERASIWPLHEQARARGARPHWLGHLSVGEGSELEQVSKRFVERGAVQLGPTLVTADRGEFLVLRDPGGAIVALNASSAPVDDPGLLVAWHVLNTNDVAAAIRNYHDLFGWAVETRASHGAHGAFYEFTWSEASAERVGCMADISDRPSVHSHWLFFFEVEALDAAVAWVRQAGGTATEPFAGPSGARVSVCEDVQQAAFGLYERRVNHR